MGCHVFSCQSLLLSTISYIMIMNMIGSRNSCVTSFFIDAVVHDHHIYKEVWILVVGEELMC